MADHYPEVWVVSDSEDNDNATDDPASAAQMSVELTQPSESAVVVRTNSDRNDQIEPQAGAEERDQWHIDMDTSKTLSSAAMVTAGFRAGLEYTGAKIVPSAIQNENSAAKTTIQDTSVAQVGQPLEDARSENDRQSNETLMNCSFPINSTRQPDQQKLAEQTDQKMEPEEGDSEGEGLAEEDLEEELEDENSEKEQSLESDSDSEEEDLISEDDIKQELLDRLDAAGVGGHFGCLGDLKDAPNPGLSIRGHGTIGFPLTDRDVDMVIGASSQSTLIDSGPSYVKGTISTSTRSIWEVPGELIEPKNPSWNLLLNAVLDRVSSHMGIAETGKGCAASLLALYLYQAGSTAQPVPSSLPSQTFGILDITLPSKHDAGQLTIQHDGKTLSTITSNVSEYDCSFSAWFIDTIMDSSLSAGRRLVLRYALQHTSPGVVCSAAALDSQMQSLKHILRSWTAQKDHMYQEKFGYVFDTHYEPSILSHESLKGRDHGIVSQLLEASKDKGFGLYLVDFERVVIGHPQYDGMYDYNGSKIMGDNHDMDFNLKRVVELDGTEVAKNAYLLWDDDDFLQQDCFEDALPDKEDYDRHEDLLINEFYATMVVVMPRASRMKFLLGGFGPEHDHKMSKLLYDFCQDPKTRLKDPYVCADIQEICSAIIKRTESKASDYVKLSQDHLLATLAFKTSVYLNNKVHFERLFRLKMLQADATLSGIKDMVQRHGIEWLQTLIQQRIIELKTFSEKHEVITKVEELFSNEAWARQQTIACIDDSRFSTAVQGAQLAQLTKLFASETEVLDTKILSAVRRNLNSLEMTTKYLEIVLDLNNDIPSSFLRTLITDLSQRLSLRAQTGSPMTHSILLTLLLHCSWRLQFIDQIEIVSTNIINEALEASEQELRHCYTLFLRKLASAFANSCALKSSQLRKLYRCVLNTIISKCVGPIPQEPKNWARPLRGCRSLQCQPCASLNSFLASPTIATFTFRNTEVESKHLQRQLSPDIANSSIHVRIDRRAHLWGLVATKTNRGHRMKLDAWKQSNEMLKTRILQIGVQNLRELLGVDYQSVLALKPVSASLSTQVVDLTESADASPQDFHALTAKTITTTEDAKLATPGALGPSCSAAMNRALQPVRRTHDDATDNKRFSTVERERIKRLRVEIPQTD